MSPSPLEEKIRGIISDLLNVTPDEIQPDSGPGSIEGWDSIRHLSLIVALEEAFGVSISPEDTVEMQNLNQIVALIQKRIKL